MAYDEAGNSILGGNKINWENPPRWAAEWKHNILIKSKEEKHIEHIITKKQEKTSISHVKTNNMPLIR